MNRYSFIWLLVIAARCASIDYRSSLKVNNPKQYYRYDSFEIEILNDYSEEVVICWSLALTTRFQGTDLALDENHYCWPTASMEQIELDTVTDDVFIVKRENPSRQHTFSIIGGIFKYNVSQYDDNPLILTLPKS